MEIVLFWKISDDQGEGVESNYSSLNTIQINRKRKMENGDEEK